MFTQIKGKSLLAVLWQSALRRSGLFIVLIFLLLISYGLVSNGQEEDASPDVAAGIVEADNSDESNQFIDTIQAFFRSPLAFYVAVFGFALILVREQLRLEVFDKMKEDLNQVKIEVSTESKAYVDILIKWIAYIVDQDIIPITSEDYRKIFKEAFPSGLPSQNDLQKIDHWKTSKLKRFIDLVEKTDSQFSLISSSAGFYIAGQACYLLGKFDKAVKFYDCALKAAKPSVLKEPSKSLILLNKGNALLADGHYTSAESVLYSSLCEFEKSENLPNVSALYDMPEKKWIFFNLGMALHNQRKYESARNYFAFSNTVSLNTEYRSLYWKGNSEAGLGEFTEAIRSYQEAIKRLDKIEQLSTQEKSDKAWILHSMADAIRKLGDQCCQSHQHCKWRVANQESQQECGCYKSAIALYTSACEIDQENGEQEHFETLQKRGKTHRQLGRYYGRTNPPASRAEYELAKQDFDRAIGIYESQHTEEEQCIPNLLSNRGHVLDKLGKKRDADKDYCKAISQCQAQLVKHSTAVVDVEHYQRAQYFFDWARCYALQGERCRTEQYLRQAENESREGILAAEQCDSDFEEIVGLSKFNQSEISQCPLFDEDGTPNFSLPIA